MEKRRWWRRESNKPANPWKPRYEQAQPTSRPAPTPASDDDNTQEIPRVPSGVSEVTTSTGSGIPLSFVSHEPLESTPTTEQVQPSAPDRYTLERHGFRIYGDGYGDTPFPSWSQRFRQYLEPDEIVVTVERYSYTELSLRIWKQIIVLLAGFVLMALALVLLTQESVEARRASGGSVLLSLAILLFVAVWVVKPYLRWSSFCFIQTNKRALRLEKPPWYARPKLINYFLGIKDIDAEFPFNVVDGVEAEKVSRLDILLGLYTVNYDGRMDVNDKKFHGLKGLTNAERIKKEGRKLRLLTQGK